jgi:hypothetical protein
MSIRIYVKLQFSRSLKDFVSGNKVCTILNGVRLLRYMNSFIYIYQVLVEHTSIHALIQTDEIPKKNCSIQGS